MRGGNDNGQDWMSMGKVSSNSAECGALCRNFGGPVASRGKGGMLGDGGCADVRPVARFASLFLSPLSTTCSALILNRR